MKFENACNRAWLQISSGAFDYRTVLRRTVDKLAKEGIKAIVYPSGHSDTLEVAVRRAVLTGVNQTAAKLQTARMDEMGWDLVEVTAHAGARPSHALWQGKIYSRSGKSKQYPPFSVTGYGTGAGLCGWNCRHSFYPYYEGLSIANYSKRELERMNSKEIAYNGQKMTHYEASQVQRYLERGIRKWKRVYLAESAAGLGTTKASIKLAQWRARQRDFLDKTGLFEDNIRHRVSGFGHRQAAKARKEFEKLLLPNFRKAILPIEKFTKYALDLEHPFGKDKAIAFQKALGYNKSNADELIVNIQKNLSRYPAKIKSENPYGQLFEVSMQLEGPNGKTAWVKTGWIIRDGEKAPRLTSVYVDKR